MSPLLTKKSTNIVSLIITQISTRKRSKFNIPMAQIKYAPAQINSQGTSPTLESSIYFCYYSCILSTPVTYIYVPDLSRYLDLIFIAQNQNISPPKPPAKTHVLGGEAFSQLKWRVNVSLGVCWDGTGNVGLLGGISGGIGLVGAGFGAFYAQYNTPSINNLTGLSMEVGGGTAIPGVSIGVAGLSWGVDRSYALTSDTFSGTLYSISGGIGLPADIHEQITITGVLDIMS